MARRRSRGSGEFNQTFELRPAGDALADIFEQAADAFREWGPLLDRLPPIMTQGLLDNIASRGASLGMRWPSAGEYQQRKATEGFGQEPLRRTGAMLEAVRRGDVISRGDNSVAVGLTEDEFPQLFGVHFEQGYVFAGWSEAMLNGVDDEVQRYADEVLQDVAARLE